MNKTIYVVLLEQNKYFVYSTNTAEYFDNSMFDFSENVDHHPDELIKMEIEHLFEFPRIYKPLQIVEMCWISDVFELDKMVKKYMMNYGIDCVRGGCYLSPILCDFQYKALQMELSTNTNSSKLLHRQACSGVRRFFSDIATEKSSTLRRIEAGVSLEPSFRIFRTLIDEEKMRDFLYHIIFSQKIDSNMLLLKYATLCEKKEKIETKLHDFMYFMKDEKKYIIDKSILVNFADIKKYLSWLGLRMNPTTNDRGSFASTRVDTPWVSLTGVVLQEPTSKEADEIKKTYNTTMNYVNHIIYLVKKYDPELFTNGDFFSSDKDVPYIHPVNFYFPHFLLDKVILHKIETEAVEAFYLWLGLEGMFYWALNIVDELTYDLEQLPDNIEWKNDVVNYYTSKFDDFSVAKAEKNGKSRIATRT